MLYLRPDGKPELFVYGEGISACTLTGPASLQDGREHHLVAVRAEDGSCSLYVDEKSVATQAARPVAMIPLVAYIGGDLRDNRDWFLGTISRVQIWQRALNADEIRKAASAN